MSAESSATTPLSPVDAFNLSLQAIRERHAGGESSGAFFGEVIQAFGNKLITQGLMGEDALVKDVVVATINRRGRVYVVEQEDQEFVPPSRTRTVRQMMASSRSALAQIPVSFLEISKPAMDRIITEHPEGDFIRWPFPDQKPPAAPATV